MHINFAYRKYLVLLLIACAPFILVKTLSPVIAQADVGMRVANFAPFEEGDAAIRVEINGTAVVDEFIYGWSTPRLSYPAGEHTIAVFPVGEDETPFVSKQVTFVEDKKYTILFVGDNVNQAFDIVVIDDDIIKADPSAAAITFGHFAPLSGNLSGTSIDIRKDNNIMVRDNLIYGEFNPADTDQLVEPLTSYKVTSASGALTFIDLQTFGYNQGDLQYLLIVGDGRNKPIAAYMYVNDGEGGFMTQVGEPMFDLPRVAFANFYSDADSESVQINFSEEYRETLDWGEISEPNVYNEGEHSLTITTASGEILIQDRLEIGLSETVIYAITKNNTDESAILVPVFGDYLASEIEPPRIKFVHLAPFTSGAYSTLDVRRSNGLIIEDDLSFGEAGDFRYLAPGEYTFRYTTRDGDRTLFDPDPITLNNGDNMTIFLIGDGKGKLIRLLIHVNGEGALTEDLWQSPLGDLSFAHLAPIGIDGQTETRIELNGETLSSSFGYGDFRAAESIITGQHEISVYNNQSGALLASRVVSVNPSANHVLIFTGDNGSQPFTIEYFDQINVDPVNNLEATIRFGNYAIIPLDNGRFDGSEVQLTSSTSPLLDGVNYGGFVDGVSNTLEPALYEMSFQDANGRQVPDNHFNLSLSAGDNMVLFAAGDGTNQPYALYSMEANGHNGRFLNEVGQKGFVYYYPSIFHNNSR